MCDWIFDADGIEVPLTAEKGHDAHSGLSVLYLEQWRIWVWSGSVDGQTVEIDT